MHAHNDNIDENNANTTKIPVDDTQNDIIILFECRALTFTAGLLGFSQYTYCVMLVCSFSTANYILIHLLHITTETTCNQKQVVKLTVQL